MQTRKLNKTLAGMLVGSFLTLIAFSESATAVTAQWSNVSVACVPGDSDTSPGRYDAVIDGKISFQGAVTGNLFFWCNVLNHHDTAGENPTWNRLFLANVAGF